MQRDYEKLPVSVVITTYNDWDYLRSAIESVFEQTFLPSQIVVIDDGSAENKAYEIAKDYLDNDAEVDFSFFRKENGGASSARNCGLLRSKEKYICFLDADDKMLPENIDIKYKALKDLGNEYFGVYGGGVKSNGIEDTFESIDGTVDAANLDKRVGGVPGGCVYYLFQRQALVDINGFDEALTHNEDFDVLIRLLETRKCKGVSHIGYYRNIRENSLSRPSDPMKSFAGVMSFLDKAERLNYYTEDYLRHRRMATHLAVVIALYKKKKIFGAFVYARKAFKFSSPVGLKQKLVYVFSFSFIG